MSEPWPCRLRGATVDMAGEPVSLDRALPGPFASTEAMARAVLRALARRRDGGRPFIGDALEVLTPLGQRVPFLLEAEDFTGRLRPEWDLPAPDGRDAGSVLA